MTPLTLLIIITIIIIASFIAEQLLALLNYSRMSYPIPDLLRDVYEEDRYRKSQDYHQANFVFSVVKDSLSTLIILAMLWFGGFAYIDSFVIAFTGNAIWQGLAFFGLLGLASSLLSLPFDVYHTFVIEEKFGFNRTTLVTFIKDLLKGWLLAILFGGGILGAIIALYKATGPNFWFIAWAMVTGFMLLLTYFYSSLIVPLFNKQKPLEQGPLREAIEVFAQKTDFNLSGIFVIDGSKRSTKANAYFSGFGRRKRIVLYDTLISDHSTEELVAILAHEIGHYKYHHTLKGMVAGIFQTGVMLGLFSLIAGNPLLSEALGVAHPAFHLALMTFALLYSPVSQVTGLIMNIFSRKHEYQADAFAATNYNTEHLITALKKLSKSNLSNLTPHPAYVFVNYSHPPLLKRLEALVRLSH
ncbi:MAG TPA: M48 family metallopeptidase [Bacteroidales bacterium]